MPTTRDPDEVAVEIGGKAWRFWDDLEVHLGLDSYPSIGFAAPFDVERADMRAAYRPCSFTPLNVTLGGDPLFTGVLVGVTPRSAPDSTTVECSGYARAANLEDVNLPGNRAPFESRGLTLRQIAEQLAGIYDLGVEVRGDTGSAFKQVNTRRRGRSKVDTKVDHDTKVDAFLVELAKQRGFVRTANPKGDLLIWQSVKPGNPVASLREGETGISEVSATFSPQEYYSEITGFTSAKRGNYGMQYTARNARLAGTLLRSLSFTLDDVEKGDAPYAVRAKMSRMFANLVTYTVHLPSWRTPSGQLWAPNTTIELYAPHAMIYRPYELLVRDVFLKRSQGEQTASLGLVLPGAFSGEQPTSLPWDEPT